MSDRKKVIIGPASGRYVQKQKRRDWLLYQVKDRGKEGVVEVLTWLLEEFDSIRQRLTQLEKDGT